MSDSIVKTHIAQYPDVAGRAAGLSTFDNLSASGFMRKPQVLEVVPISAATLWRKCKAGEFPKPVKLSERVTAWRVADVREWLSAQALK